MVPRAYAIIAIAAGALGLAMVAATVSTGSILGAAHPAGVDRSPSGPVQPRHFSGNGTDPGTSTWFTVTMTVLLGCYVLAIAVLIALHRRGGSEEAEHDRLSSEEPDPADQWQTVLAVDLGSAANEALARLGRGTPRNAIVACWLGLQGATRVAGLPELLAETPVEYTMRAVDSLDLEPTPIIELSRLYREARFSDHAMGEDQRQHAGRALQALADQLAERSGAAAPGRPVPVHVGHQGNR